MIPKPLTILGLNPGTKYTGWTVFVGPELRDWGIKTVKGRWSKAKVNRVKELILGLIDRYRINLMAVKRLHPARSSRHLKLLVSEIIKFSRAKRVRVITFSLKELESIFSENGNKINKKQLTERIVQDYPPLFHLLEKEKRNKNPYHLRLFEAVALGAAGYYQNEK